LTAGLASKALAWAELFREERVFHGAGPARLPCQARRPSCQKNVLSCRRSLNSRVLQPPGFSWLTQSLRTHDQRQANDPSCWSTGPSTGTNRQEEVQPALVGKTQSEDLAPEYGLAVHQIGSLLPAVGQRLEGCSTDRKSSNSVAFSSRARGWHKQHRTAQNPRHRPSCGTGSGSKLWKRLQDSRKRKIAATPKLGAKELSCVVTQRVDQEQRSTNTASGREGNRVVRADAHQAGPISN